VKEPEKVVVYEGVAASYPAAVQIGGLPDGFPLSDWPLTAQGEPLTFLARVPLQGLSSRFAHAFAFMAQTYDAETSECINDTFDLAERLAIVVPVERLGEDTPTGPSIGELAAYDLRESWLFGFDVNDETPDEWIDLMDEEPVHSAVRVGGPLRWWQGGYNHPLDSFGNRMRFAAEIQSDAHPGLDLFISSGVAHLFFSEETGEGVIVWEVD